MASDHDPPPPLTNAARARIASLTRNDEALYHAAELHFNATVAQIGSHVVANVARCLAHVNGALERMCQEQPSSVTCLWYGMEDHAVHALADDTDGAEALLGAMGERWT